MPRSRTSRWSLLPPRKPESVLCWERLELGRAWHMEPPLLTPNPTSSMLYHPPPNRPQVCTIQEFVHFESHLQGSFETDDLSRSIAQTEEVGRAADVPVCGVLQSPPTPTPFKSQGRVTCTAWVLWQQGELGAEAVPELPVEQEAQDRVNAGLRKVSPTRPSGRPGVQGFTRTRR